MVLIREFLCDFPAPAGDVCGLSCSFCALLQLLAPASCLHSGAVLGRRVPVATGIRQLAVGLCTVHTAESHHHPTIQLRPPVPGPRQLQAGR